MAKVKSSTNFDISAALRRAGAQFSGLDTRDPSSWPDIPKYILYAGMTVLIVLLLWFVWLRNSETSLQNTQSQETKLRADYQAKVQKAVNLDELKKQRVRVLQYVSMLEKQLPSKSEMDALLSDINQAGLGRGLQFELFRPAQVVVKDYYVEQPIAVRVSGSYHDIGAFTADVANLSRIVTLNNIAVSEPANDKNKSGTLVMEATAKTFRYLDAEERAAQLAATNKAKQGGRK
ncbi:MAG: type 4a pilus biogenesis protein PilO [Burkholderiaceae bacterium]|jgi:type IV pilus assembly protein PilO|nr:type 4a pilus biogenesis protein PilO [Burkholderiaceae bacterium]